MDIAQNCSSSKFMYRKDNLDICLWGSFFIEKKHCTFESKACSSNAKGKKKSETTRSSMLDHEILNPSTLKDFTIATHPNLVSTAAAPRVYPQRIPTERAWPGGGLFSGGGPSLRDWNWATMNVFWTLKFVIISTSIIIYKYICEMICTFMIETPANDYDIK